MTSFSTIAASPSPAEIPAAARLLAEVSSDPDGAMTAEVANAITHGLGFVFSVFAAVVLLHAAAAVDMWQWTAVFIYAVTMVAVYAASTASHVFSQPKLRHFFRMLDQGCIYLFIAGTFTPIAAAFLRVGPWWILLAAIWIIAIGGFLSKVAFNHRVNNSSAIIPLVLGWLPLAGGWTMLQLVPIEVRWWVLAGGVCYSIGILFLISDHRHRYLHAMWHLWVIAGTACHFWAILNYTLPAA
ncbi:MAG TPA: hemolysin III family protein [Pirellulales bacterium]|jgi:hemolysin III